MREALRGFIILALLAINGLIIRADNLATYATDVTAQLPPYMWVTGDSTPPDRYMLPDSSFNAIAGATIFKVDRTELNLDDPILQQLKLRWLPEANARRLVLVGIDLRGAASPEGPYDNNVRLARGRAKALCDFLIQHLDSVDTPGLTVNTTPEDYARLLWLMKRAGDSQAYVLENIINDCGLQAHEAIKQRLRDYDSGELWSRLLNQYFPELRAARIVLIFKPILPQKVEIAPDPSRELALIEPLTPGDRLRIPITLSRPHILSLSSNILYDAFYMPHYGWAPMPNIGVEYYPSRGNFTFRAAFTFPYYHRWSRQQFFQIRDYHLEARRYFSPGALHTGTYLAAYINATKYGIGLSRSKGWQGEGIGGAFKVGYVLPLGPGRFRLDFHLAAGAWMTRYDPYVYGNPINGDINGDYYYDYTGAPADFRKRNYRMWWFGPTELGVTLTFDLLYKRIFRPGVSAIGKEVVVW